MDEKRVARYIDELNHIEERLGDIDNWIREAEEDKKSRLAVYKAIQEAVEAACDIVAMYLKDEGYSPKDDYTNLEKWGELEDEDISDCLKVANGLRNRLVHHYNGIDDSIAIDSIMDVLPCLSRFSEVIEEWLKKK